MGLAFQNLPDFCQNESCCKKLKWTLVTFDLSQNCTCFTGIASATRAARTGIHNKVSLSCILRTLLSKIRGTWALWYTTVYPITEGATKRLMGDARQKDDSYPSRMEQDNSRFHHATQNGRQFEIYKLYSFRIFHLIFLNHSWPR